MATKKEEAESKQEGTDPYAPCINDANHCITANHKQLRSNLQTWYDGCSQAGSLATNDFSLQSEEMQAEAIEVGKLPTLQIRRAETLMVYPAQTAMEQFTIEKVSQRAHDLVTFMDYQIT
jgi:hypothetical protein